MSPSSDGEDSDYFSSASSPEKSPNKEHKEKKKKDKSIGALHPFFELTHDMMVGIRTVVGRSQAKPQAQLMKEHFTASNRLKFPSKAKPNSHTPSHKMADFYFKDYAPEVFRRIRKRFGIDPAAYINDVCGNNEYLEFISNSKSGEFFFFSHSEQYMIKTISHPEARLLREILPKYYKHIKDNPDTLMARFFGLHKVRVRGTGKRDVYFLIMGSVFYSPTGVEYNMDYQFDLKGSSLGRSATEKEKARAKPVLKDNDLLDLGLKMRIGRENAQRLNMQLAKDVALLKELNIMDYSLLIGISKTKPKATAGGPGSPPGPLNRHAGGKSQRNLLASAKGRRESVRLADHPDMRKIFLSSHLLPSSPIAGADFSYALSDEALETPLEDSYKPRMESFGYTDRMDTSHFGSEVSPKTKDGDLKGSDIIDDSEIKSVRNYWTKDHGGFEGTGEDGGTETYFFGIIDILITYGMKKKMETRFKSFKNEVWTVSAVDPFTYAERFRRYMADAII
jgi:1-phosphatidylinositol-4-phosphate 5-kinase